MRVQNKNIYVKLYNPVYYSIVETRHLRENQYHLPNTDSPIVKKQFNALEKAYLSQNHEDLKSVVANSQGVREVIAITNGGDEAIVQQDLDGKAPEMFRADGQTTVMAHPEVTRRGQFLGLLDAIRAWKETHGDFRDNEVSVGIMMPGQGTRMSPLTQRAHGIKPFLTMLIRTSRNGKWLSGMAASIYSWNLVAFHLKRMGFQGMAWKWGDEPLFSGDLMADMNLDLTGADAVRFGSRIVVTPEAASSKDWLQFNPKHPQTSFKQVRRRERSELLKRLGVEDVGDQTKAFAHLGSPAFSYMFLEEAEKVFGHLSGMIDVDGYLFDALTQTQDIWDQEKTKDAKLKALDEEFDFYSKVQTLKANINRRRGREADHPLNVQVVDFGENLYWGDIGQLKKTRETLWAVNDRVSDQGQFARKLALIDHVQPDQYGNIVVGDSQIPQDGSVRNSIVIDTKIYGQASINGAVLVDSQLGQAQVGQGSVVINSTVKDLSMGSNAYSHMSVTELLDLSDDFVHTSIPSDPKNVAFGLENWVADTNLDVGSSQNYKQAAFGNPDSFESKFADMRQRDVQPNDIEKEINALWRASLIEEMKMIASARGNGSQSQKPTRPQADLAPTDTDTQFNVSTN